MPEQVFEIEPLKVRAVALLKRHGDHLTTGKVASELRVPLYAADAALERAFQEGLLQFTAGPGWRYAGAAR